MTIGLASITVAFKKKASTALQRGNNGIVALLLRDSTNAGITYVNGTYDIPSTLSEANKKYINLALLGNVYQPQKIIVCVIGVEDPIQDGLDLLELEQFNLLTVPVLKSEEKATIKSFIEKMRDEIKYKVKGVLNSNADYEAIINSTTDNVVTEHFGTLNKDELCTLVAGVIAGTPLNQSVTFTSPKEIINIPAQTKVQAKAKVEAGELILVKEMGKIRFARGVNSLTTTNTQKTEEFKKIKLLDTMDLIHNDIRSTCIENYIGKVANNYDNKCKLIVGIDSYLDKLSKDELIEADYSVGIDIASQTNHLKSKGVDITNMSEQDIKQANTGDKVFIKIVITLIDAMEDITVYVEI
ncbi:phage tail sheath C-terminal domain-containing protein [Paraclostridium ghonii]|uniref:phage tail sheath C-terminal domain-containing protein n=1 Tax=Paraclostridium ghonii TaxID=29358 RepID=UPI00202CFE43|nr:phage tail sheath C-terminal domain-containing protein [Paeniclostridium ghonii]MCM0166999.1 phage tail sheath subtilisin-like domain-containing protein [Paeniclostridium ghonii]